MAGEGTPDEDGTNLFEILVNTERYSDLNESLEVMAIIFMMVMRILERQAEAPNGLAPGMDGICVQPSQIELEVPKSRTPGIPKPGRGELRIRPDQTSDQTSD